MKIDNNFLMVSNYNADISWILDYTDNYIIYDRSDTDEWIKQFDQSKVIKSKNIGYNFYDYFTFIIDNYENLPDNIIFSKGNIFPRHIDEKYFNKIMNNVFFTPIEDWETYKTIFPISFLSVDGGFNEINNSWYLKHFKTKYFKNYNDFLRFIYKNPIIPRYIRFAPGGNYIVQKNQILKIPKVVYRNLRLFISHCQLPGEAHIIERFIYTLWVSNFELSPKILETLDESFVNKDIKKEKLYKKIYNSISSFIINSLCRVINKLPIWIK